MGEYSIKDLERLSNIKAHTLRIWEKRYNLFEPDRTETNIRKYSDDDLKRLLKIATLSRSGMKISKIVALSNEQIAERVNQIEDEFILKEKRIDDLIIPMIEYDQERFETLYSNYVNQLGVEHTFKEIIYPFLEKVGLLWLTDDVEPAQEHFMTHLIRQKLTVAIDELPSPIKGAKKVILFLPPGEFHELGLLFLSFLYKLKGIDVIYLGQSIPVEQVALAAKQIQPNWVFTYTVVKPRGGFQKLINELESCECEKVYFLMPRSIENKEYSFPSHVQKVESYSEVI